MRIAVWSGPRNLSTAMMRSFGNRSDTVVTDEPLYAHYLLHSDLPHPGRDEVISQGETNLESLIAFLTGPPPRPKPIWYQKQMAHHLLPGMRTDWLLDHEFTHVILIRDPRLVIPSLAKILTEVELPQTGLPQQLALFEALRTTLQMVPPVIDYADIMSHPRRALEALCEHIGIAFEASMLAWEQGPRASDGIWGKHWYGSLWKSTGFAAEPTRSPPRIEARHRGLVDACHEIYSRLASFRIQ